MANQNKNKGGGEKGEEKRKEKIWGGSGEANAHETRGKKTYKPKADKETL